MPIPVTSTTDYTPGIIKLTGASSCDDSCPEHGTPTVTVEPIQWEVLADGKRLGSVITVRSGITSRWYAYGTRSQKLGDYDTQAEAVAAVVAESTKPAPEPCPTCGAVTA